MCYNVSLSLRFCPSNLLAVDAKRCYATGRGIQPKGVRIGDDADFKVHTKGAGQGDLKVQVIGPGGIDERVTTRKIDQWTYECVYKPTKPGNYVVNIMYSGDHITKSPYRVDVGPFKQTKIVAYGPGLEGGTVDYPANFTVETNGETGALGGSWCHVVSRSAHLTKKITQYCHRQ